MADLSHIRALSFDADQTLWDFGDVYRKAVEKPDPRAFETLAAELDVACNEIMHVGDDWDDIEGANAVEAVSVFMNRSMASPAFAATADHQVADLNELESLLSS